MHGHEAVRGAHEVDAAPAVGQLVAHDLGDRQPGNGFVERLLHAVGQQHALGRGFIEQGLVLALALALEAGHGAFIGTQRRQLLEQRGRGLAVGRQAHGDGHELLRDGLVLALRQHLGDVRGQPSRRGIGRQAHRGRGQQALGLELLEQDGGKGVAELLQRLGRQLFDKQFNQKI